MIRHHPSAETLADYAGGKLHSGAMLVVACHLHACVACSREVALLEGVGGALLAKATPEPLTEGALDRAMARLSRSRLHAPEIRTPAFLRHPDIPRPLQKRKVGRRRWLTPSIWFATVAIDSSAPECTYVVCVQADTTLPLHTHAGEEFTLVLRGSFSDGRGHYTPGDFAHWEGSPSHAPATSGNMECLCLVSSDAPMRLADRGARILQKLFGKLY